MPQIEFLYFQDCPSHAEALALLQNVLHEQNLTTPIQLIQIETEVEAHQHTFYGSPTIRVNGRDIEPLLDKIGEPGLACRTYRQADNRITSLPPRELIEAALRQALPL